MIRILSIFVWIEIIIYWVCVNSLYNNVGELGILYVAYVLRINERSLRLIILLTNTRVR